MKLAAKSATALLVVLVVCAGAQEIAPRKFVQIALPLDSPLEVVAVDFGQSRVTRGERSLAMNLSLMITVRNQSRKTIEAIAVTLGYGAGKSPTEGLSAVAGIRLAPGATYLAPARMQADIELPRPGTAEKTQLPDSAWLRLDAVLFADGSTYGPDRLRALMTMRITQAESARDRRFFQGLLHTGGLPKLIPTLERSTSGVLSPGSIQPYPSPRVVSGTAAERARALAQPADFRVERFPAAPLEIVSARARVYENGLVDPSIEVRNITSSEITDFLVSWVLKTAGGIEFRAATLSGSASGAGRLHAGETRQWTDRSVLEAGPAPAGPVLTGRVYLRAVQYSNGQVWVPEWQVLERTGLIRVVETSPESFRLMRLYKAQGPAGLTGELR